MELSYQVQKQNFYNLMSEQDISPLQAFKALNIDENTGSKILQELVSEGKMIVDKTIVVEIFS